MEPVLLEPSFLCSFYVNCIGGYMDGYRPVECGIKVSDGFRVWKNLDASFNH